MIHAVLLSCISEWIHGLCMMMTAGCCDIVLPTLTLPFQYSLKVIVYLRPCRLVSKVLVLSHVAPDPVNITAADRSHCRLWVANSTFGIDGGVAQWLERRSSAGELSLSCARPAAMGDHYCG